MSEKTDVMAKTPKSSILRTPDSPVSGFSFGMLTMTIAMMHRRLKAADPTMVPGPKGPAKKLKLNTSITERRISGAEEPKAIRVRLATVAFHVFTSTCLIFPLSVLTSMILEREVMISMDPIKISAMMLTPINVQNKSNRYTIAMTWGSFSGHMQPYSFLIAGSVVLTTHTSTSVPLGYSATSFP
eukprot:Lithocolla_globosa_v1_NODE_1348_length_2647_cov_12.946373.p2 type:complete len:185 gc:universal NODE_1348_length_2647_cov_12.946373:701-147(-)